MGFSGISIWQLLIILAIVALIFGTKKLRGMGNDMGGFLNGFKKAMNDEKGDRKNEDGSDEKVTLKNSIEETGSIKEKLWDKNSKVQV